MNRDIPRSGRVLLAQPIQSLWPFSCTRFHTLQVLQKVVTLSPEEGFEKYMYLGQLLESPEEAIAATTRGVELLQQVRGCGHAWIALAVTVCCSCSG